MQPKEKKGVASVVRGSITRRKALLVSLVSLLSMAVLMVSPTAAQAASCDGTYLYAAQTNAGGTQFVNIIDTRNYPEPSGEFSMPTIGTFRFLSLAGTVKPDTRAGFVFFLQTPTGETPVYAHHNGGRWRWCDPSGRERRLRE